jgi:hypothetical protein
VVVVTGAKLMPAELVVGASKEIKSEEAESKLLVALK